MGFLLLLAATIYQYCRFYYYMEHSSSTGMQNHITGAQTQTKVHVQEKNDKPLFILHVGPAKTATTAIQCHLGTHLTELEQDNIHYIGHFYPPGYCGVRSSDPSNDRKPVSKFVRDEMFRSCIKCVDESDCNCTRVWDQFDDLIKPAYAKNQTVMMSDEMFSQYLRPGETMDALVRHLGKWNVRVLYTYRRFYQIFPSSYAQQFDPDTDRLKEWPDHGGVTIPSISEYYFTGYNHRHEGLRQIVDQWETAFPGSVQIANMNTADERGFINHFVCEHIPEASRLCRVGSDKTARSAGEKSASKGGNTAVDKTHPDWDRISMEAYRRGWIDSARIARRDASQAVKKYTQSIGLLTMKDFDMECISPEAQEALWNDSLSWEQELMPELLAMEKEQEELKLDFEKQAKKFCSVDVEKTLAKHPEEWKQFFASL